MVIATGIFGFKKINYFSISFDVDGLLQIIG
jgi:hypothetical protein